MSADASADAHPRINISLLNQVNLNFEQCVTVKKAEKELLYDLLISCQCQSPTSPTLFPATTPLLPILLLLRLTSSSPVAYSCKFFSSPTSSSFPVAYSTF